MVLGGFGKGTTSVVPLRAARNSGFKPLRVDVTLASPPALNPPLRCAFESVTLATDH
jgi:hypothetical protein